MFWIFGGAWVRRGQAVSNQKKRHLLKSKLIPIFLPLVLFGCSKKEPTVSLRSVATSATRIALSRTMTDYAWKARGSDWADKVKDKNWDTFFARLQKSLNYLQEAR